MPIQREAHARHPIEHTAFDRLAAESPFMIWRYHPDGEPAFINRASLDFLGQGEREALQDDMFAMIHPQDQAMVVTAAERYMSRPVIFSARYRQRGADQKYRWVLEHCRPNFDAGGDLLGHFGSCREIAYNSKGGSQC